MTTLHYDEYDIFTQCGPCQTGHISQISRTIFISDWEGSLDLRKLDEHNIKSILCLNDGSKPAHIVDKYIENDIRHKQIYSYDHPAQNLIQYFQEIFDFIAEESEHNNVLVHCTAGVSRSVTAVASYLMSCSMKHDHTMNVDKVLKYISKKRSCANPNQGFVSQLRKHEEIIRKNI